jgi:hypothetical protein
MLALRGTNTWQCPHPAPVPFQMATPAPVIVAVPVSVPTPNGNGSDSPPIAPGTTAGTRYAVVAAPPPNSYQSGRSKLTTTGAGYYALNVLLNTVLFMLIFMTAASWAAAAQETIKRMPHGKGMLMFAGVSTAVTFAVAVGFGLLSDAVPNINVNYASLLDQATPGN